MAEHEAEVTNSGLVLSNKVYDALRFCTEKVFPGLGLFYATVAAIWGWNYAVEVGGTFAALSVLGAIFLTLARKGYDVIDGGAPEKYDGAVVEDVNEEGVPILRVQLDPTSAQDIMNKTQLVIKGYDAGA